MPVQGADDNSYNPKSFWFYPWGESGTHKGVDIFAHAGTSVRSSTPGIVVFKGCNGRGGNTVIVLGPKWRFHHYAHLKEITAHSFSLLKPGTKIGTVGNTGNAAGKPSHLHYSIVTLIPYVWRVDFDKQGLLKMFYLNPIRFLEQR